jgi:transcriptional antiterminator
MRLEGHQVEEIAQRIGCSERTVRRVLDKIKTRLLQQAVADGGESGVSLLLREAQRRSEA